MDTQLLAERIAFVKQHCEKLGRDFREIEISCVVGYEDAEPRHLLESYAAAGAHRLIFFCPGEQGTAPDYGVDGMQRRLDVISKNYLNAS